MLFSSVVFCCRCSCRALSLSYQATKETGPNIRDKQQAWCFSRSLCAWEEAGSISRPVLSTGGSLGEGFLWHNADAFPTRSSLLVCRGRGSRIWEQGECPLHVTKHASDTRVFPLSLNNPLPLSLSYQVLMLVIYILKCKSLSLISPWLAVPLCKPAFPKLRAAQLWPGPLSAWFPCHIQQSWRRNNSDFNHLISWIIRQLIFIIVPLHYLIWQWPSCKRLSFSFCIPDICPRRV